MFEPVTQREEFRLLVEQVNIDQGHNKGPRFSAPSGEHLDIFSAHVAKNAVWFMQGGTLPESDQASERLFAQAPAKSLHLGVIGQTNREADIHRRLPKPYAAAVRTTGFGRVGASKSPATLLTTHFQEDSEGPIWEP